MNISRYYTSVNFMVCGIVIFFHQAVFGNKFSGIFVITFAIQLIPFFVINGLLTALPVVWYNNDFNLGFRLYTIPFEDLFYSMSLLLANVTIYESLRARLTKKVKARPEEIFVG